MKVAIFSAKNYDREFLEAANTSRHELQFFEPRLSTETASLAAGFEAVCVFVNDQFDTEVIATLAKSGTRLIALRCAACRPNQDPPTEFATEHLWCDTTRYRYIWTVFS
jgi:D-lactate dehydrogenase